MTAEEIRVLFFVRCIFCLLVRTLASQMLGCQFRFTCELSRACVIKQDFCHILLLLLLFVDKCIYLLLVVRLLVIFILLCFIKKLVVLLHTFLAPCLFNLCHQLNGFLRLREPVCLPSFDPR